ncbi:MAG: gluconate 2-dehydrogenase subunit 3 family protein [Acidimicrobiales bacterium]
MEPLSRRQVLRGTGLAGLAALLPPELLAACSRARGEPPSAPGEGGELLVLDTHEAAVVREATARLIPGPLDDPAEAGHPGAREANVTRYIDWMLGALTLSPAKIFAGGPFSNRAGFPTDDMARFIGLSPAASHAWSRRLSGWKTAYRRGVRDLDKAARGSFLAASTGRRDDVLASDPGGFTTLLFSHAIEAMYSNPEYGGNAALSGWKEIGFPGDVQPRGYSAAQVSRSDGPDPYRPEGITADLLTLIAVSNGR